MRSRLSMSRSNVEKDLDNVKISETINVLYHMSRNLLCSLVRESFHCSDAPTLSAPRRRKNYRTLETAIEKGFHPSGLGNRKTSTTREELHCGNQM